MKTTKMILMIMVLCLIAITFGPSKASSDPFNATVSGSEVTATGTEPTKNEDGTDLKDLHHVNVYYQKGTEPKVKGPDIPSTAPTGGGAIATTVIVPLNPAGEDVDVIITGTATDDATPPNESKHTPGIVLNLDNQVPGTWD